MKKFALSILILGILGSCTSKEDDPQLKPENPQESQSYVDVAPLTELKTWEHSSTDAQNLTSLEDFSYRLNRKVLENYSQLWNDPTGNYAISPVSISVFIGALSQSVDSEPKADLCRLLGVGEDDVAGLNNKLIRYLSKNRDDLKSAISNSVWHHPSMPILASYREKMASLFGAPVNSLDMYVPQSKDIINLWACDKTDGVINNYLQDSPNIDFLIANAFYYSAAWMNPFQVDSTSKDFFQGSKQVSEIDFMHKTSSNLHARVDGVEFMPIALNESEEMDILMPSEGCDFDQFGAGIDSRYISTLMSEATTKEVALSLPKFEIRSDADLREILGMLGYPSYDMSTLEMTGTSHFPLKQKDSFVRHSTAVKVNEKGIELAAITAGGWASSDGQNPEYEKVEMNVNRPFYFVIRNTDCNSILMIGRVCNL